MKGLLPVFGALALSVAPAAPAFAAGTWKPTHPINIIVPWAAGGATDQVTRIEAAELEKALGQTIVIVNQPGASGSIGTKSVLDAPRDGYTWSAGAVQDLGSYETQGMLKTRLTDWNLFLTVANVPVLAVNSQSPYRSAKDLLAAMAAKPGQISVATAGITSAGHTAMDLAAGAAKVTYRHVAYDGGTPAVIATVAGETVATTQTASEEAGMIRAQRLRPLATISDQPLALDGFGTIPTLSQTVPGFNAPANYTGIFIPKGVPDDVIRTVEQVWNTSIAHSEVLQKYATSHGALFKPLTGDAAQKASFPAVQANAWMLFKSGKAKMSPATVGIPAL
ncbi:MAG TPA: tripartite tricarboxylate transporter substrate binding protein [Paraburkholderia sp.]